MPKPMAKPVHSLNPPSTFSTLLIISLSPWLSLCIDMVLTLEAGIATGRKQAEDAASVLLQECEMQRDEYRGQLEEACTQLEACRLRQEQIQGNGVAAGQTSEMRRMVHWYRGVARWWVAGLVAGWRVAALRGALQTLKLSMSFELMEACGEILEMKQEAERCELPAWTINPSPILSTSMTPI